MSSGGQILGGIAGGILGSSFGYPFLGAQLGMMVGGLIDPPKGPTTNGPTLSDLTIQTSTYGAVIPRIKGTVAVTGNIFWLEGNQLTPHVTKKKSGGKGGGGKTTKTTTYSATFAVGLVDTKAIGTPIVGVRRLWVGSDLFYDAQSDDFATIAASNAASDLFKIYTGSDTQLPDPRIQADLGVDNCPAWRGLAYIVFYDLQLEKYGNSLMGAPIKAEVVQDGAIVEYGVTTRTITHRSWTSIAWNGSVFCTVPLNQDICSTSPDGVTWTEHALPTTTYQAWWDIESNGDIFVALAWGGIYSSPDGIVWTLRQSNSYYNSSICWSGSLFLVATDNGPFYTSADGVTWTSHVAPMQGLGLGSGYYTRVKWTGSVFLAIAAFSTMDFLTSPTGDSGTWTSRLKPIGNNWINIGVLGTRVCVISSNYGGSYTSDDCVTWTYNASSFPVHGGGIGTDGKLFYASNNYLYYTSPDGVTWTLRGTLPVTGGNTWDDVAWNGAVFCTVNRLSTEAATIQPYKLTPANVTLGDVVASECLQSGVLQSADIDTTALTSSVRGYKIGSVGSLRSALEPLQAAWPFDIVQHGYKIKFLPRGGSSIGTVTESDLDARSSGGNSGVKVTLSREMDSQLPRRVVVNYMDFDREYETGTQYEERTTTASVNETALSLPIVLNATEAAGKAQVLLYMYWMERFDVSFTLPATYNQMEPGDVVGVPTSDGVISVRLVAVNNTSDGRVECKAKYADSSVYTSTAVGSFSAVSGSGAATVGATDSTTVTTGTTTIPRVGTTRYELMDIPLVHSDQNTPSFVASMYGQLAGWEGGVLVRTDDSGSTWTDVQGFAAPGGVVGTAVNTIGTVDCRVWDKASTLSVSMAHGELYDATDLAVLNGANYFAYGLNGRWEILAAQKCTLVSGTQYVLSDFLRGRFGTEWATGLHVAGDKIVYLSTDDVILIGMSSSSIGLPRTYRGVTNGQDISTASDTSFTYAGVNLECLSPVYFNASRSLFTNDWALSWIRRSRTDGEWRDLVDVGLGESSENYSVDIFSDNTYTTVKRTVDTTTPSLAYTSAQQITDFGVVQKSIYAKVYQLSSVVGRGYPAQGAWMGISGDPYYSNVVFLQNVQGGAGWKPPRDLTGKAITWNGNATVSAAQSPFGVSSAYFDGTGDYIESPANSAFNLGTGDFCMEAWVFIAANSSHAADLTRGATILTIEDAGGGEGLFYIGGSAITTGTSLDFYTAAGSVSGSVTITQSVWHHLVATRESGLLRIFADGALVGSGTLSGAIGTSSDPLRIGQRQSGSYPFPLNGYIGPHRIVKGAAVYTSNFSIPSTFLMDAAEADPYYSQVVLNLPMTGANNGTVFPDYKGHAVTVVGNAKTSTTQYLGTIGSSGSFDGTNSQLTVPASTDFAFGTGDFCIEAWVYISANSAPDLSGNRAALIASIDNGTLSKLEFKILGDASTTGIGLSIGVDPGTGFVSITTGVTVSQGVWHLVEVNRTAGVVSFYLDGLNAGGGGAFAHTMGISTSDIHLGGRAWANNYKFWLNGYMGPVRITKGSARHTSNYPSNIGPFQTF